MAFIAGGTRTCETSTAEVGEPARSASQTAMALGGAVVSKPIAKKTTWRCGIPRGEVDGVERRIDHPHVSRPST